MNSLLRSSALLSATLLALSAARATDTVVLDAGAAFGGNNPFQSGSGGEFTAFASGLGVPAGYASDATFTSNGVTGFETFCVEDQVTFTPGTTYDYSVSPNVDVPVSGNSPAGATTAPLSQGAAWLYQQFATGSLSGYDYVNASARLADAGALQDTIWWLQGQAAAPTANAFTADVTTQFGSTAAAMAAETNDQFGVNVLNLYTTNASGQVNGIYQSQLVYQGGLNNQVAHAPDSSSTVMLFGGALLLVGLAPRLPFRGRRS